MIRSRSLQKSRIYDLISIPLLKLCLVSITVQEWDPREHEKIVDQQSTGSSLHVNVLTG